MMRMWKFLVMIYSEQSTHLIINKVVLVFIIETLFPLKILGIQYFQEYNNFEIRIEGILCRFRSLDGLPSQSQDNFEAFTTDFELNIYTATASSTFLIVVLIDFNVESNLWFNDNKRPYEGSKIDGINSTFGLQ